MKAISRAGKIIFMFLIFIVAIFIGNENVFAATTDVSNFTELEAAVVGAKKGDIINVNRDITVTKTLQVKEDITIKSDGEKTLTAGALTMDSAIESNMFYVSGGKELSLDNITLDGANEARLIRAKGAKINLNSVTMKNGSTENLQRVDKNGKNDQNYSGGAILAEEGSTVIINGGSFENNNTGTQQLDGGRAAEGGAIKIDSSVLTINGTKFEGNHLDHWETAGGRQGGSIEATNTTISIENAEFTIPGPFNTGGAIKFENCPSAYVNNSKFTILGDKKPVGMAGGAITSEGSYLTIDKSKFYTGKGSYVQESGGLIQVVGAGTFDLKNSELNGSGYGWNESSKYKTAKYGGAIVFYDNSTVKATIENTTIQNFTAEISGGAIALNTQVGKSGGTELTLIDTKLLNNLAYAWNMTAYGGGMFVGKGNTVTMQGGEISSKDQYPTSNAFATSSVGGAIYNEGKLTLTKSDNGNAQIINNKAYHMAAGILNDGELTVDFANFSGNAKGDWSNANQHVYNKNEMAGENIYAVQDVTITPNAEFDGKDIRIIEKNSDGETSKIILTGPLTNQLNVSISEVAKTGNNSLFVENQKRKVGYVVAEPDAAYKAKIEEENAKPENKDKQNESLIASANQIHYVSKDTSQAISGFADHTSPGKWDFVLNPETKEKVLGQRVKLIYHGNTGKFGTEEKKEKTVDVYKVGDFWEKQLDKYKVADPSKDRHEFMAWYFWKSGDSVGTTDDTIQNIKYPDEFTKNLFDFSRVKFSNNNTDEIVNILTPNVINTYAGWSENIELGVQKTWEDAEESDKTDVSVTLKGGEKEEKATLTNTNNYYHSFADLKVFTKLYENNEEKNMNLKFTPREYSVVENKIDGFTPSYSPEKIVANEVGENNSLFTVTNKKIFKVTYEFKSGTEGKTLPAEIEGYKPTDNAEYADGATVNAKEPTKTSYEDTENNGTWTFTSWDQNSKTINKADIKFVGTWTFTETPQTKYKVTYEFKSGTEGKTLPAEIEGYKPTDTTEYADGATVNAKEPTKTSYEDTENNGTWTFTSWDQNSKTINKADVKFVGMWTFIPKEKPNPEDPKPPVTNIITEYVDIYGNELIPSKDGDQPVEVIPGYEFIETKRTEKVVSHIYKKIEKEESNPWFPLFPRVEREEKVETHPVNAVVPDKVKLNKEDHKAYMFGYPDWTFLPNNNMTRAEVTAMFARLLKNYPSTNVKYNLPYRDVFESDWYYPAVGFMTENNIIKGYEDGTFRPNAPITRAEFATIASKFDEILGGDVKGFYDVPASHWALKYINSAYERGWVSGYEDGSFRPDRFINRAEVVTVTNKMLIRYADIDYVRAHRDLLINFKDLDESHWAYFNIMEATHGHDFMRKANGKDETWERLNGEAFIFPELRYKER